MEDFPVKIIQGMMKEPLAYFTAAFVGPISCILVIMLFPPQKSKSFRVTNFGFLFSEDWGRSDCP
jgi:hypothetical protein